jgi:hypothetical protein
MFCTSLFVFFLLAIVITFPGLQPGQSIMMQPLSDKELTTDYRSDSSPHFQPYIVNPDTTSDLLKISKYV